MRACSTLIVPLVVALSLGTCAGQTTASKPLEPEFVGVFFYLDPGTQQLRELPLERYKVTKDRHHIFFDVSGANSPLRLSGGERIEFIFKIEHPESAQLLQFIVSMEKKTGQNYRRWEAVTTGGSPDPRIPVEISKFGESSYKLTPRTPLGPGEYTLLIGPMLYASTIPTFAVGAN